MTFLRHNLFRMFLVILTLSVFAGDLIADAIPNDAATSVTHGSHNGPRDQGSCPDCCAVHGGAAIVYNGVFRLEPIPTIDILFTVPNEHAPNGDPASIDYPPRLA